MKRRHLRKGFTLTEMVCVLAVMTLLLGAGVGLIATVWKTGRLGDATGDRIGRRSELAKQFRHDVARAVKLGNDAGPEALQLRFADGTTVTYGWNDGTLMRIERKGDRESSRVLPLENANVSVNFQPPSAASKLCTMRIVEAAKNAPPKVTEYSAALGGDFR